MTHQRARRRRFFLGLPILAFFLSGSLVGAQETVPIFRPFKRGDVNVDGGINVADAVTLLDYLFSSNDVVLLCEDAADVNDDEQIELSDAIYLLSHLFSQGPQPPGPFVNCGFDPTLSTVLTCESYPPCDSLPDPDLAAHLMRRMGFGPTPEGLEHILMIGTDAYIQEQLFPELIDESQNVYLQALLPTINPEFDLFGIIQYQVILALYSERQLQEALVDFWENHFSTPYYVASMILQGLRDSNGQPIYTPQEALAEAVNWEYIDNESFRANALGSFEDLVITSAISKMMLVYLDSIFNIVGNPNENYARELLELHTMGVDNGYIQQDVEQVARCFTGWTICRKTFADGGDPNTGCIPFEDPGVWAFHFEPTYHDYGAKLLFAGEDHQLFIPARPVGSPDGILDGFQVIAHLATLPETARYVSTKLIQRFVSDDAPPALVDACEAVWLATDGDIRQVVQTILTSSEFLGAQNRWTKVTTPFEFLVTAHRASGAPTTGVPVVIGVDADLNGLFGLNHLPFFRGTPDGYQEGAVDWMGTTTLLNRIKYVLDVADSSGDPAFDPLATMQGAGVPSEDADAIVDFWLQRLYQNFYTPEEREIFITYLETDVFGNFDPLDDTSVEYEDRIRGAIGLILSAPQAQKQ